MKPSSDNNNSPAPSAGDAPLPTALTPAPQANRPVTRAYPWLLLLSTMVAAAFCLLYITKPVIVSPAEAHPVSLADLAEKVKPGTRQSNKTPSGAGLLPSRDRLPGDTQPAVATGTNTTSNNSRPSPPALAAPSVFEETNLRIQHILTAEAPGGHLDRLDIDVPVLYQSRNLRWTSKETAEARNLLARLMDYQEKSCQLRAEGSTLLEAWNRLISDSIPTTVLRADSPSLPANQQDAANTPLPGGMITNESIQIKPPAK